VNDAHFKLTDPIKGTYYTVNPIAVNNVDVNVFGENKREVCVFDTKQYGEVVYVLVGATMVGSIVLTAKKGSTLKKGEEVGHFAFGGSSVLLMFQKGAIKWDNDLIENSKSGLETLVRMGEKIGESNGHDADGNGKEEEDIKSEPDSVDEVDEDKVDETSGDDPNAVHHRKRDKLKHLPKKIKETIKAHT